MKDEKGLYYHPFPQNKKVRMYVSGSEGNMFFRLWNSDDPALWTDHKWVPYDAIKQASGMYKGKDFDPGRTYDIELAKVLIQEDSNP